MNLLPAKKIGALALLALVATVSVGIQTSVAQAPPDVGFNIGVTCPDGYALTNGATGPSCIEEVNRAKDADTATAAQSAQTAVNAQTAQNATTAGTALNLDPNAQIDIGNIGGLPSCNDGRVLTNTPSGLECVQVATGARGFANKQYITAHNGTFNVPAGVFEMRVTAAAGNTVQYRQNYGQTGYSGGYVYAGGYNCSADESGNGFGCHCPSEYSWNGSNCQKWTNYATYGCQTASQSTALGASGTKTFAVTPGQSFKALLTAVQVPVSVSAPHNQCAANYDLVYLAVAELPSGAPEPNIYSDKRNSEVAGEMSVSSAMIVEW